MMKKELKTKYYATPIDLGEQCDSSLALLGKLEEYLSKNEPCVVVICCSSEEAIFSESPNPDGNPTSDNSSFVKNVREMVLRSTNANVKTVVCGALPLDGATADQAQLLNSTNDQMR
eukprot:CAMPEP_0113707472 /NCGR_PEP_ID=MMETSP0038_2-20120614/28420_1 /TAXON_ID=2898 /ORGANISM="Cryptomonas paramecium" /LENGTH=116 /DNA_ID=CAMNT_0000633021 /DNA_START=54 /DNA_END=400 /DNA_ORIENTATION=- /assembly_acc=CAM_ASM_000170